MISTVFFDADGVLIRTKLASQHFEEAYGISRDKTIGFYKGPFLQCLLGERDMYEVLPEFLNAWGWPKTPEAFVAEWFDFENKPDARLLAFIQRLRQSGIACYVATNQEKLRAQYMLERMRFDEAFDGLVASSHIGAAKPDEQFFERALAKLKLADAGAVLFWDDALENVEAAHRVGLQAEVYTEFDDFLQTMNTKYHLPTPPKQNP